MSRRLRWFCPIINVEADDYSPFHLLSQLPDSLSEIGSVLGEKLYTGSQHWSVLVLAAEADKLNLLEELCQPNGTSCLSVPQKLVCRLVKTHTKYILHWSCSIVSRVFEQFFVACYSVDGIGCQGSIELRWKKHLQLKCYSRFWESVQGTIACIQVVFGVRFSNRGAISPIFVLRYCLFQWVCPILFFPTARMIHIGPCRTSQELRS